MNSAAFFASLRRRESGVFGTSLSQSQVQGIEAILDACDAAGATLSQTAYMLATPYGETGGKMQAVRENLNYSASSIAKHFGPHRRQGKTPQQLARNPRLLGNTVYGGPWGAKHLGNVGPNDGYDFRGFGIGQWTGRRNTEKAGRGVGLDLVANPALLDDINVNAKLLVDWMMNGKATGKKLGDYVNADRQDYRGARAVWGGVDATKYVGYAKAFEIALNAGGYSARPEIKPHVDAPKTPKAQEVPQAGGFSARIAAIFAMFTRKGKK